MSVSIVSPVASPSSSDALAAQPRALSGGVLGVLVNGKEYAEEVLRRVVERLRERYDFQDVLWWDKKYPATPAPFLDEIAARCSFVLNGVGH